MRIVFIIILMFAGVALNVRMSNIERQRNNLGAMLVASQERVAVADLANMIMVHGMKFKQYPASIKELDPNVITAFHAMWPNVVLQDGTGVEPPVLTFSGPGFGIYEEHGTDGKLHLIYWPHEPRNHRGE
jgi:hypothetical protein